jgi:hypothetical protein
MIEAAAEVAERATQLTQSQLESFSQLFSDLEILTISTHITELSYSISDIQTRIFGAQTAFL